MCFSYQVLEHCWIPKGDVEGGKHRVFSLRGKKTTCVLCSKKNGWPKLYPTHSKRRTRKKRLSFQPQNPGRGKKMSFSTKPISYAVHQGGEGNNLLSHLSKRIMFVYLRKIIQYNIVRKTNCQKEPLVSRRFTMYISNAHMLSYRIVNIQK